MLIFSKMREKRETDYYDVTEIIFYKSRSLESVSIDKIVSQKCRSPLLEFARISIFDIHIFLKRKKKKKIMEQFLVVFLDTCLTQERQKRLSTIYL